MVFQEMLCDDQYGAAEKIQLALDARFGLQSIREHRQNRTGRNRYFFYAKPSRG
jgi:hypothetical protein